LVTSLLLDFLMLMCMIFMFSTFDNILEKHDYDTEGMSQKCFGKKTTFVQLQLCGAYWAFYSLFSIARGQLLYRGNA